MIGRDIKCDFCGHQGKVEAHDTVKAEDSSLIFELLGKTDDGFILFRCPKCGESIKKSPFSIIKSPFSFGQKNRDNVTYQVYKPGEYTEFYYYKPFLGDEKRVGQQHFNKIVNGIPHTESGPMTLDSLIWATYMSPNPPHNLLIIDYRKCSGILISSKEIKAGIKYNEKELLEILKNYGYHKTPFHYQYEREKVVQRTRILPGERTLQRTGPRIDTFSTPGKLTPQYIFINIDICEPGNFYNPFRHKDYISPTFCSISSLIEEFEGMMGLVPEDYKKNLEYYINSIKKDLEEDKKKGELNNLKLEKNFWRYGHYMITNMGTVSIGSISSAPFFNPQFFIDGNEWGLFIDRNGDKYFKRLLHFGSNLFEREIFYKRPLISLLFLDRQLRYFKNLVKEEKEAGLIGKFFHKDPEITLFSGDWEISYSKCSFDGEYFWIDLFKEVSYQLDDKSTEHEADLLCNEFLYKLFNGTNLLENNTLSGGLFIKLKLFNDESERTSKIPDGFYLQIVFTGSLKGEDGPCAFTIPFGVIADSGYFIGGYCKPANQELYNIIKNDCEDFINSIIRGWELPDLIELWNNPDLADDPVDEDSEEGESIDEDFDDEESIDEEFEEEGNASEDSDEKDFQKLEKLNELKEKGIITKKEFQLKKKEIVSKWNKKDLNNDLT